MFANFKDTFIKKPQYSSAPPKAVMEAINKDLPEGFEYIYMQEGICRLDSSEGFNLEAENVQLPKEAENIMMPNNPTPEQIEQYLYNSQTVATIFPDKEGCFKINGKKIKARDIIKAPLKDFKFGEDIRLIMKPRPFPQPFEIVFSGNGYDKTMHIHRLPNNSLNIQHFESIDEYPLSVVYYVNTEKKEFTITFTLSAKNAKSVQDILSAYGIYNAFMDGKGKIDNEILLRETALSEKRISQQTIDFWRKLYELENIFEIKFDIKDGVTVRDSRYAEEIYRCIVQKKPYKVYKQYGKVRGKGIFQDENDISSRDKAIYFEFTAEKQYELLGQTISLKGVLGIFDACIEKLDFTSPSRDEFEIMLQNVDGKKMYESIMLFRTNEEVIEFRKNTDHIKIMEKADEIVSLE